jgi:DNA invertase Pin-like site-specific DNA recombinase
MAAMAQHEREMIAKRTREALAARKARGLPLGTPAVREARALAYYDSSVTRPRSLSLLERWTLCWYQ